MTKSHPSPKSSLRQILPWSSDTSSRSVSTRDPEQAFFTIHASVDGREMRVAAILKPESRTISSRHSLARFKEKYGAYPEKGMKIEIETNENGFWTLVL